MTAGKTTVQNRSFLNLIFEFKISNENGTRKIKSKMLQLKSLKCSEKNLVKQNI